MTQMTHERQFTSFCRRQMTHCDIDGLLELECCARKDSIMLGYGPNTIDL
jgi:hypothetical protein